MAITLSLSQQRILARVSSLLLSPGSFASEEAWHREIMGSLMPLLKGSKSAIRVPEERGFRMTPLGFEERAIEEHQAYYHQFDFGQALGEKPALGFVFSRNEYYGDRLPLLQRTEYYSDYIARYSAFDALCLSSRQDQHALGTVLYVWHDHEKADHDRRTSLQMLRMLAPSFRAGMNLRMRMTGYGRDVASAFERCSEGIALIAPDGSVQHQNNALTAMLAATADDALSRAVRMHASDLCGLATNRNLADVPRAQTLRSGSKVFEVSGCIVESADFRGPAILVMVRQREDSPIARMTERHSLTPREAEVTDLLCSRMTTREISVRLGISEHTVRHHVENVLRKLDVRKRREVAGRNPGYTR